MKKPLDILNDPNPQEGITSQITFEDLQNFVKMLNEPPRSSICIDDLYRDCFCCLTTGEVMKDVGSDQWAILMGPRGGLSVAIGSHIWWFYISKKMWEHYLKFCHEQKYSRNQGPFADNARGLPINMGGTGRLIDIIVTI